MCKNTKGKKSMRTYIKKQLWDLLDSIEQMQSLLINITDQAQIITMLADCQQAAITIGETLERDSSDHGEIISLLEEYCEEAFLISQSQQVSEEKKVSVLSNLTDRIKPYLENILENYQIVFLPYKASMWDSLESIWLEAQKDKRCECYVIPIPYYLPSEHWRRLFSKMHACPLRLHSFINYD